jgi:type IX secretion system PorP/SprF family membrane protein
MKKLLFTIIFISICFVNLKSQDIHFSQYDAVPLLINPGLTGAFQSTHRAGIIYRDQWRNITNSFKTFAAFYDGFIFKNLKIKEDHIGIGFVAMNDVAGDLNYGVSKFDISLSLVKKYTPKNQISFGLMGGLNQCKADFTNALWDNQYTTGVNYDPLINNTSDKFMFFDLSAGANWYYMVNYNFNYNIGVGIFHLNYPKQKFTPDKNNVNLKFTINANARFVNKKYNYAFVPSVFYQNNGPLNELVVGINNEFLISTSSNFLQEATISFGAYYRIKDSFIPVLKICYENFEFGISYDINVSTLKAASSYRGATEFSLVYVVPFKSRWANRNVPKY